MPRPSLTSSTGPYRRLGAFPSCARASRFRAMSWRSRRGSPSQSASTACAKSSSGGTARTAPFSWRSMPGPRERLRSPRCAGSTYRTGLRMRWLYGELRWLAENHAGAGRPDTVNTSRALFDFCLEFFRTYHYDAVDYRDVKPALIELLNTIWSVRRHLTQNGSTR